MSPANSDHAASVCDHCGIERLCRPAGYSAETLRRIIRRKRAVNSGDYLFRAGEPFRSLFAVCGGSVKTYSLDRDGAIQVTGFHVPGELVGLGGMASGYYVTDAVALEPSSVCELLCEPLKTLRQQDPALNDDMHHLLSLELMRTYKQLSTVIGKRNGTEKLSAFVYALCQRLREHGLPHQRLRLTMSRSDIANYLGLTKETVCRMFTRLEGEGLLSVRGKYLYVTDLPALGRHAGLDCDGHSH